MKRLKRLSVLIFILCVFMVQNICIYLPDAAGQAVQDIGSDIESLRQAVESKDILIIGLEQKLADLRRQIKILEDKLIYSEQKLQENEKTTLFVIQKRNELETKLKESENLKLQLQSEVLKVQSALTDVRTSVPSQVDSAKAPLEQRIKEATQTITDQKQELLSLKTANERLEKRIELIASQKTELETQMAALNQSLQTNEAQSNQKVVEVESYYKQTVQSLEQQLTEARKTINDIESDKKVLYAEMRHLKEGFEEEQRNTALLTQQLTDNKAVFDKKLTELDLALQSKDGNFSQRLESETAVYKTDIQNLRNQLDASFSENEQLKNEKNQLVREIGVIQNQLAEVKNNAETLQLTVNQLNEQLAGKDSSISEQIALAEAPLNEKILELTNQVNAMQGIFESDLKKVQLQYEEQRQSDLKDLEVKTSQLALLQQENKKLYQDISNLQSQNSEFEKRINELAGQIKQKDTLSAELQEKMKSELKAQMAQVQSQKSALQNELENIKTALKQEQSDRKTAEEEILKNNAELQMKDRELAGLGNEISSFKEKLIQADNYSRQQIADNNLKWEKQIDELNKTTAQKSLDQEALAAKNRELQDRLRKIEQQLIEKTSLAKELESKYNESLVKINQHQAELDEKVAYAKVPLEAQIEVLKGQLTESQQSINRQVAEATKELHSANEVKTKELDNLKNINTRLEGQLASAVTERDSYKKKFEDQSALNNRLNQDFVQTKSQYEEALKSKDNDLIKQKEMVGAQLTQAQQQLQELAQQKEELLKNNRNLENQLGSANSRIKALDADIVQKSAESEAQIKALREHITMVEKQSAEKTNAAAAIHQSEKLALNQAIKNQDSRLAELADDNKKANSRITGLSQDLKASEMKVAELTQAVNQRVLSAQKEKENYEQVVAELKTSTQVQLQEQGASLNSQITSLQQKNNALIQEVQNLKNFNQKLNEERIVLDKELKLQQENSQQISSQNIKLQNMLIQKEKDFNEKVVSIQDESAKRIAEVTKTTVEEKLAAEQNLRQSEQTVQGMIEQNKKKDQDIALLREKLAAADLQKKAVETQLAQSRAVFDQEKEKAAQEFQNKNRMLSSQIGELTKQIETQKIQFDSELQQRDVNVKSGEEKISQLTKDILQLRTLLNDKEQNLKKVSQQLQEKDQQYQLQLAAVKEEAALQAADLKARYTKELEQAEAKQNVSLNTVSALETDKGKLKQELSVIQAEFAKIKLDLDKASSEAAVLKQSVLDNQKVIANEKKVSEDRLKELTLVKSSYDRLTADYSSLKQTSLTDQQQAQGRIDSLVLENQKMQQSAAVQIEQAKALLTAENKKLNEQLLLEQAKQSELVLKAEEPLKSRIGSLQAEITSLQGKLSQSENAVRDASRQLEDIKVKNNELVLSNKSLSEQFKNKEDQFNRTIAQLNNDYGMLQKETGLKIDQAKEPLHLQIASLQNDIKTLRDKLLQSENNASQTAKQLEEEKNINVQIKSDREKVTLELKQKEAEYSQAVSDLRNSYAALQADVALKIEEETQPLKAKLDTVSREKDLLVQQKSEALNANESLRQAEARLKTELQQEKKKLETQTVLLTNLTEELKETRKSVAVRVDQAKLPLNDEILKLKQELDVKEKKIQASDSSVQILQKEKAELQNFLVQEKNHRLRAEDMASELNAKIEELTNNMDVKISQAEAPLNEQIQVLKSELDNKASAYQQLAEIDKSNKAVIAKLQKDISQYEIQVGQLQKSVSDRDNKIQSINQELSLKIAENRKPLEAEIQSLKDRLTLKNQEIDAVKLNVDGKIREAQAPLLAENQRVLQEGASLKSALESLKVKEGQLLQVISDLEKTSSAKHLETQSAQQALKEMQKQNDSIRNELGEKIVILQNSLNEREKAYDQLNNNYTMAQTKLADLENSQVQFSADMKNYEDKVIQLNDLLVKKQMDYDKLQLEIADLLKKTDSLNQQNADLSSKIADANKELEASQARLVAQAQEKEKVLRSTIDELQVKIISFDQKFTGQERDILELKEKNQVLNTQLAASQSKVDSLIQEMELQQQAFEKNENLFAQKTAQVQEDLKKRMGQLEQELAQSKAAVNDFQLNLQKEQLARQEAENKLNDKAAESKTAALEMARLENQLKIAQSNKDMKINDIRAPLKTKIDELEKELNAQKDILSQKSSVVDLLNKEKEDLQKQIALLKNEKGSLEKQIAEYDNKIKSIDVVVEKRIETATMPIENKLSSLQETLKVAELAIKEGEMRIAKLKEEKQQMAAELSESEKEIFSLLDEVLALKEKLGQK